MLSDSDVNPVICSICKRRIQKGVGYMYIPPNAYICLTCLNDMEVPELNQDNIGNNSNEKQNNSIYTFLLGSLLLCGSIGGIISLIMLIYKHIW